MSKWTKEKRREYYNENKEKLLEISREYRKANKEKILEQKRRYESQPHRREIRKIKSKKEYQRNKEKYCVRTKQRRIERKTFIDAVSLKYGCQNPNCRWQGELETNQIDFHHFDPSQKEIEIAKMHSWSYGRIVDEINKCVCFCKNCHTQADRGKIPITEEMICKVEVPNIQ